MVPSHFIIAVQLVSAAAASPGPPHRVEVSEGQLAKTVDDRLTQAAENGFGGSAILEREGKLVLKAGYGFADRESKVPFTADTVAQIGSITKTFTALALLQLAEERKVERRRKLAQARHRRREKNLGLQQGTLPFTAEETVTNP